MGIRVGELEHCEWLQHTVVSYQVEIGKKKFTHIITIIMLDAIKSNDLATHKYQIQIILKHDYVTIGQSGTVI